MRDSDINFLEVQDWLEEYKYAQDEKTKLYLQNLIALRCLPLVKRIARGLARRSTDPIEDLIQIGSLGLIKAINLYDSKIGKNFKTYSTYLITGEIRHYLRDKINIIKAPREIQELAYRVNQVVLTLSEELGVAPTDEQIADRLHTSVRKLEEVRDVERRKQTISLDQLVSSSQDDCQMFGDKIMDVNQQSFLHNQENAIMLKNAISRIDKPLQEVVFLHFFEDLTQREIASRLGISQMQVSRRIKKALNELFLIIVEKKQESF